jgi:hypothetical protein
VRGGHGAVLCDLEARVKRSLPCSRKGWTNSCSDSVPTTMLADGRLTAVVSMLAAGHGFIRRGCGQLNTERGA